MQSSLMWQFLYCSKHSFFIFCWDIWIQIKSKPFFMLLINDKTSRAESDLVHQPWNSYGKSTLYPFHLYLWCTKNVNLLKSVIYFFELLSYCFSLWKILKTLPNSVQKTNMVILIWAVYSLKHQRLSFFFNLKFWEHFSIIIRLFIEKEPFREKDMENIFWCLFTEHEANFLMENVAHMDE